MVIKPKERIGLLERTPEKTTRRQFLRLDMNEGIPLEDGFLKEILTGFQGTDLAMYPEYHDLRRILAEKEKIPAENILLSNGSDSAIKHIFDAYISPGDCVLLTDPTFAMYPVYCEMYGASTTMIEYNNDLTFPLEEYVSRLETGGVRMAVVVNTNNPTGTTLGEEPMRRILDEASRLDTLMVVDEAYQFTPHTVIKLVEKYPNLVVLRSFSKLWGAASMRLGYAAGDLTILENIRRVRPTYDVNGVAVWIACQILQNPGLLERRMRVLEEGRSYLEARLREAGIPFVSGDANFILIRCGERCPDYLQELATAHVLVSGGFKQRFLRDFIRVTIADRLAMEIFWRSFLPIHLSLQGKGLDGKVEL
jgi:histidinol-phosphate aminotransferase